MNMKKSHGLRKSGYLWIKYDRYRIRTKITEAIMSNESCDYIAHRKKTDTSADYTDEEAKRHARERGVDLRPAETKNEIDDTGAFIRQPNAFTQPFGDKEGDLKAEAGRYSIYWAKGCNWSNRPIIVRDLLGLQNVIGDQLTSHSGTDNRYGHGLPRNLITEIRLRVSIF